MKYEVTVYKPVMDWLVAQAEVEANSEAEALEKGIEQATEEDSFYFGHCGDYDGPSTIHAEITEDHDEA